MTYPKLRMKFALSANDGGAWGEDADSDSATPVLRSTEITLDGRIEASDPALRKLSSREKRATTLRFGDILVVKSSGSDAHLGKSGWVGENCAGMSFSNFVQRLRVSRSFDARFTWYFMNSAAMKDQIRLLSSTTTGLQNLSGSVIREIEVPSPSIEDQRRIANFLDAEVDRVERITQKVQAASLLASERFCTALEHAFDAYRADSVRMKFLLREPLRYGANAAAEHDDPGWPRYIRITDIDSHCRLRDDSFKSLNPGEAMDYILEDRDILFARSGATVGKSFMYRKNDGPACFAGYLIRARFPVGSRTADIVRYFTMTKDYWRQIAGDNIQATIQNVSAERYGNIVVPRVSDHAQSKLLDGFDEMFRSQQEFAEMASRQLALLAERRQALITAAVTGQIDVTTARGVTV